MKDHALGHFDDIECHVGENSEFSPCCVATCGVFHEKRQRIGAANQLCDQAGSANIDDDAVVLGQHEDGPRRVNLSGAFDWFRLRNSRCACQRIKRKCQNFMACHNSVAQESISSRTRMGEWMRWITFLCLVAMLAASPAAYAEPDAALVDALRQEDRAVQTLLRQGVAQCQDAIASINPAGLDECILRLQVAEGVIKTDAVKSTVKKLQDAVFLVDIGLIISRQNAIGKSREALPVYSDFNDTLEQANMPVPLAKQTGKKA